MAETFKTKLQLADDANATGIVVPSNVVAALGSGKKPKVKITINSYEYRSTVAAYNGLFMLPFSQDHRKASGINAGDVVEVTLELDTEPRTVDLPTDLQAALKAKKGALEKFEALSYSIRKNHVYQVNEAKTQETRERRIAKIVDSMG
jgi:bacteriocin resistance YdeI/OmpD-like protein/uncharacterized protein DUF1905